MLEKFELYLQSYRYGPSGDVLDAVEYGILNPGKRIRPMLLLSLLKDYNVDIRQGFSAALAIEMIHNYSLMHDDLPAMDNDDYRRGKLSTHKKFNEATAILAGDALLTMAFEVIANDENIDADKKVELFKLLSRYAGIHGMIYGQQLDLAYEGKNVSLKEIENINIYKTSNLLIYSLLAAAVIANTKNDFKLLKELATKLGLAFQIQDDIFDVTKSFEDLGKKPSDENNDKSTYVKMLGLEKSKLVLNDLFEQCFIIINSLNLNEDNLFNLVKEIQNRNN